MNADATVEVQRVDCLEFNRYGANGEQIILWEYNPACWVPADWTTRPCGEWCWGMWLDANGRIVVPHELRATKTWHDPERRAFNWWREQGFVIDQGGTWRK